MSERLEKKSNNPLTEVILEAVKGIKNEVLLYGIVVVALLVSSAYLSLEILKEIKWPLIILKEGGTPSQFGYKCAIVGFNRLEYIPPNHG